MLFDVPPHPLAHESDRLLHLLQLIGVGRTHGALEIGEEIEQIGLAMATPDETRSSVSSGHSRSKGGSRCHH